MLGIYIHIPFCVKKCLYCDFLSFPAEEHERSAYVEALLSEIETEAPYYAKYRVDTVFFGGGTPSVLKAADIERIMEVLKTSCRFGDTPEITIEVNPGTADKEKLLSYKKAGINRLSIGTQSVHEGELKALGRIHNASDFFATFRMAREAGFDNVNVDLMAGLPGQTAERYRDTLYAVLSLKPEHISAYSLIIEEGTPFFDMYGESTGKESPKTILMEEPERQPLPSEEEERAMYEETERYLKEEGYYRYEISNYAKKGRECRHNTSYWKRYNYVGFGLGAASMIENVRWKNTSCLQDYINVFSASENGGMNSPSLGKNVKEEIRHLREEEQMEEFMFLGLRLTEGVSRTEFFESFRKDMENVYGEVLKELSGKGLIESSERIKLTSFGRDVSNYVMAQFLL